jgi:hypothetical protein
MKRILLPLVLLTLLLGLSGCVIGLPRIDLPVGTQPSEAVSTASNTQPTEAAASSTGDSTDIDNLPEEFYLYQPPINGWGGHLYYWYSNSFTIEVPTEFTLVGDVQKGDMQLGIRSRDSKEYLFPLQEVGTQTTSIILEPGEYALVLKGVLSDGSLRITGAAVE